MFVSKPACTAIVRLLGVKTFDPVRSEKELQVYAREAVATLRRLEGTRVTLAPDGFTIDRAQRVVATMTQDTRDVGLSLVSEGVAFVYSKYPFPRLQAYVATEAEARARHEGLWSSPKAAARVTALQQAWVQERQP
jgi:endonuclease YncB( thermonuclease family)